jgi:hypothetical protein
MLRFVDIGRADNYFLFNLGSAGGRVPSSNP